MSVTNNRLGLLYQEQLAIVPSGTGHQPYLPLQVPGAVVPCNGVRNIRFCDALCKEKLPIEAVLQQYAYVGASSHAITN